MLLLSAWWVKDLLFALAAGVHDVCRRWAPRSAVLVGLATLLAAQAANLLKSVFDRQRLSPRTFGRVYLGVHFAGDVVAGALPGASIAAGVVVAGRRLLDSRFPARQRAFRR